MIVSVMTVKLYASWVRSLKEKRGIVKSLCEKLRRTLHVSVIESDAQDVHQTIILSIAFLSGQTAAADSMSESIQAFIQRNTDAEMVDIFIEKR